MELTAEEEAILLKIGRSAISTALRGGERLDVRPRSAPLNQQCGCFVTIKQHGRLRGCLGNFTSDQPLFQEVADLAVASATRDPRFAPMTSADLDNFTLEISVLSPLRKIDTLDEIEVGRHGLYLIKGHRRGVLLPQVAIEHGWDRTTFLSQTSLKAGLPGDAWRDPKTEILSFSAQVFGEE